MRKIILNICFIILLIFIFIFVIFKDYFLIIMTSNLDICLGILIPLSIIFAGLTGFYERK